MEASSPYGDYAEVLRGAEALVQSVMSLWDSSHDSFHAFRVRDLALSLAAEEGLSADQKKIVELAALLHDIDDYKYSHRKEEHLTAQQLLMHYNIPAPIIESIMYIIHNMGFKDEMAGSCNSNNMIEFGIVQDADRLDAMGAIGIARCFTFGGTKNNLIYHPNIEPCINLTKEEYMNQERKQTSLNHFHEKLLKLKDLMKTKAGRRRAVGRHKFMEDFLTEFHGEWQGKL